MDLPNLGSFSAAGNMTWSSSLDDSSKKVRKPYTISKSRESWTEPEHDKFIEALHLFDRDWKKIEAFIGSKTVIQIRSHAQKYFLKVQKSGTNEHLPPPRPKRKAAHPYPQKASKAVVSQENPLFQTSPAVLDAGLVRRPDSSVQLGTDDSLQNTKLQKLTRGNTIAGQSSPLIYSCSSSGSSLRTRPTVLPDFAQVYSFIGGVFDPNEADHLQKLKKMDPIDIETILLLMRNLANNLASPSFEDHKRVLSTNEIDHADNAFVVADSYLSNQSEAAA